MGFAFFDFDQTIIHGDAGPLFGVHLFNRRKHAVERRPHGPVRAVAKTVMWGQIVPYVGWMAVQTSLYQARAVRRSTIVRSAYRGLKGVPVQVMEEQLDGFVADQIAPRIYPEIRAEMEAHVAAGRQCIIITTGMQRLVERCLPFLPPGTIVVGCQLEEANGKLTGKVRQGPLYGRDKANIMLAFCRSAKVDPATCHAYTDHYSDHQMLEAVGSGTCVNPAGRLRKMATKRGWRVLDLQDPRELK